MSQKTITFRHVVDGTLTDVTSATLSDPTGTFGFRVVGGSAILAAGAELEREGDGVYARTIQNLTPGVQYEYWVEWVYEGEAQRLHRSFVAPGDGEAAPGRYIDQADVEDVFGVANVAQYSNLDNDDTGADVARIGRAIAWAEDEIDNFFRDSRYAVPLIVSSGNRTVVDWAAKLAGVWLYNNRGLRDDTDGGIYAELERTVRGDMRAYKSGRKKLDAATARTPAPTCPQVV